MNDEQKPEGRNVGLSAWLGAWLPIETAPKDGTRILGFSNKHICIVYFTGGRWWVQPFHVAAPSCWLPLPEAPNAGNEGRA